MKEPPQSEEAIFGHAVELPAAERNAYVDQACGDDAALRGRVEALLRAHDEAGDLLDAAPGNVVRAALSQPPLEEKPGAMIGRYKLLQKIGEGGCGVVFMAEQLQPVVRRVALKVIKLGMDTKEVIARFEAERQALAMMNHPNIAKVLDAGATDTGRPYFVMELVRGVKITDYCDQENLSTTERLNLFVQVCHAIQHAHQKGIIHRDIKPSNILVTLQDGAPMPKVIDFGIAKATQGRLTDHTLFTAFEQFIGTPAYMSPEQAQLSSEDVDTRSDIYSLGVLLYELLTGQTPFESKQLLKAGLDEMRRQIREVEPQKPSTRLRTLEADTMTSTAQHRATVPPKLLHLVRGDLDWIVMRCLEKNRVRRYATSDELARDLERHLHNEPVAACPPSALYRFRKLVRRNKLAVVATTAIAAALVIGLVVSLAMYSREKIARERAMAAEQTQVSLRRQADTEAKKSRQVAQFLSDMLQGVGPEVALGRDTKLVREILAKTTERVNQDLKEQPEVEAELFLVIGKVQRALGEYDKAEAMLRESLVIRRKLFGDMNLTVADSLYALSGLLDERGRFPEADAVLRECLAIRTRLLGPESAGAAEAIYGLASSLMNRGDFATAEPLARQALAQRRILLGNEHTEVADALVTAGMCQVMLGNFTAGKAQIREAVALYRKAFGDGHPKVADTLTALGAALFSQGDYTGAEPLFREALAAQRKVFGPENPDMDLANSLLGVAACLTKRGDYTAAEPVWREALAIARERHGDNHPVTSAALTGLAELLMHRADYPGVEALLLDAERIVETAPFVSSDLQHGTVADLVEFYTAWSKTDPTKTIQATKWQQRLDKLNKASPETTKPGSPAAPEKNE